MKKEITAYITAMANEHQRRLRVMKSLNYGSEELAVQEMFMTGISDLMDFVQDIPEKNEESSFSAFSLALENSELKKRISELEESCEHMNAIEKNLHRKIEVLTTNNKDLQMFCYELRGKNNLLDDERLAEIFTKL